MVKNHYLVQLDYTDFQTFTTNPRYWQMCDGTFGKNASSSDSGEVSTDLMTANMKKKFPP